MVNRRIALYNRSMNLKMNRVAFLLVGAVLLGLFAAGCNTTKGFGRDVEKLGDKIEQKASR
jgi:predicted small secreted protein